MERRARMVETRKVNNMIIIPLEVIRNKELSVYDKLVFGRIYSFRPNTCFMRISDLVKDLNISRSTIIKSIANLKYQLLIKESDYGFDCFDFDSFYEG